jgi:hypothetical protein
MPNWAWQSNHPDKPELEMAKGGKTNEQMLKLGRNLAKIANQKKAVRSVRADMGKVNKNG